MRSEQDQQESEKIKDRMRARSTGEKGLRRRNKQD